MDLLLNQHPPTHTHTRQVRRALVRASRDIRFNDVLANACSEDRKAYCSDVQPVSGPG